MATTTRIGCIIALVCTLALQSEALPRFSIRTGMRCQSCHVNPTGAGMRQAFGVEYGREKLPVSEWTKDFEVEDVSNVIANFLGVGADFRTLFYTIQLPDGTSTNTFYEMQGDLYINFRVARKVSVYLNKGLYKGFEAFGLLNILPASGWIKVGKFVPNFGTRLDDHTAFIRRQTGFTPEDPNNRYERTGLEAGISPGPLTVSGGIYNSVNDDFAGDSKAFLGRAEGLFHVGEKVNFGLGGDIFVTKTAAGLDRSLYGGLGSISLFNLAIFGEADYIKTKNPTGTVTGFVSYVEADYPIIQGVDLKVAYDFFDPDINLKTGSTSRYSFGFEFFPIQGVEVRPVYRLIKDKPVELHNDEFHLLVHFYI